MQEKETLNDDVLHEKGIYSNFVLPPKTLIIEELEVNAQTDINKGFIVTVVSKESFLEEDTLIKPGLLDSSEVF